jgi:hypothetical protein
MTSGAFRVPLPSRPSKKQGLFPRLTPRHSRKLAPIETEHFEHETDSTDSDSTLELPHSNGNGNGNDNGNGNGNGNDKHAKEGNGQRSFAVGRQERVVVVVFVARRRRVIVMEKV